MDLDVSNFGKCSGKNQDNYSKIKILHMQIDELSRTYISRISDLDNLWQFSFHSLKSLFVTIFFSQIKIIWNKKAHIG